LPADIPHYGTQVAQSIAMNNFQRKAAVSTQLAAKTHHFRLIAES
jgi:hypothetical protein